MKIIYFLKIKCHLAKYLASNTFSALSILHTPSPLIHEKRKKQGLLMLVSHGI